VLWGESRWGVVRAEGADFCEKNGKKGEETRIMCEKLPPSAKTALIFASTLTIFLLDPLLGDTIAIVGSTALFVEFSAPESNRFASDYMVSRRKPL